VVVGVASRAQRLIINIALVLGTTASFVFATVAKDKRVEFGSTRPNSVKTMVDTSTRIGTSRGRRLLRRGVAALSIVQALELRGLEALSRPIYKVFSRHPQSQFSRSHCSSSEIHGGHLVAFATRGDETDRTLGFGRAKSKKSKVLIRSKGKPKKSAVAEVAELASSQSNRTSIDRWGLPLPTLDDIFPLMSQDTELIPVDPGRKYSLVDIEKSLESHIQLDLSRFDADGVEIAPPTTQRSPMKLHLVHQSPPVLVIENFFTHEECQQVIDIAMAPSDGHTPMEVRSATFSPLAQSQRTSTSWFCYYSQLPTLLAKTRHILGIPLPQLEEPQIVRYRAGEEFTWHYDEVPRSQMGNGGQRLATLLVYLNTVENGGETVFRDLKQCVDKAGQLCQEQLSVQPVEGHALLFFPAYRDGRPDDRTLHKGGMAASEKWIVQMWIHERAYEAAVPPRNSQFDALPGVEKVSQALGYQ
jgi:prolyl 4-hydroxylase